MPALNLHKGVVMYEAIDKKRKYTLVLLVFILVSTLLFPVFAEEDETDDSLPPEDKAILADGGFPIPILPDGYAYGPLGDTALKMNYEAAQGPLGVQTAVTVEVGTDMSGNITTLKIADLLDSDKKTNETIEAVNGISTAVQAFRTLAIVLAVTFFCVGLANDFVRGQAYGEILIKKTVVLIFTLFFLYYIPYISFTIMNFGQVLLNAVSYEATSEGVYIKIMKMLLPEVTYEEKNWLKDIGSNIDCLVNSLALMMSAFLPWLLNKATMIGLKIIAYGRAIEMLLMGAFSPIAIALHPLDNGETTKRVLKHIFAIAIQGAIICAGIAILGIIRGNVMDTSTLEGSIAGRLSDYFITRMLKAAFLSVVMFGFASRSRSIANALVGL